MIVFNLHENRMKSIAASYDITVTQKGSQYVVSGKDAPALHAKISGLPPDAKDLEVGALENGTFILRKHQPQAMAG
jgi:hypothetical protein